MIRANRRLTDQLAERLTGAGCEPLREDLGFFDLCSRAVPPHALRWLIDRYVDSWQASLTEIPDDHKAQNIGRRSANLWLLSVMKQNGLPVPTGEQINALKF